MDYQAAVDKGDFNKGNQLLLEILELKNGLPEYNIALIYNNLGYVNWNLGRYGKSQGYYTEALKVANNFSDEARQILIHIYNNQAILFKQKGKYHSALIYYDNAITILFENTDTDKEFHRQLAMLQLNKGLVYLKLKDYLEAIKQFLISAKSKEEHKLPYLGSVYFNLARAYNAVGEIQLAREFFVKSIEQWSREYDSTYLRLAVIYLEYAQFLAEQGDDVKAREYFQKSIDNYLSNYGTNHPYTASCYNIISDVHFSKGEYDMALEYAQMALKSICPGFESGGFLSNPTGQESLLDTRLLKIYTSKIDALVGYAKAELAERNVVNRNILDFAMETADEAIRVLTRIQNSYLSQESRLFLAEDQKDVFIQGIEVSLMLHELTGNPGFQEKAYQYAAFGKALELNYEILQKEQLYLSSRDDSGANKLLEHREDIESYSYLIQSEQNKSNPDSTKIAEWSQGRFDKRRDYELLHDSVFGSYPSSINVSHLVSDHSITQVRSKLKRNQTLIEYSISTEADDGSRHLFAFVIDRRKLFIYKTMLDSTFSVSTRTILGKLHGFDPYLSNEADRQQLDSSLACLYSLVFEPFRSHIAGKSLTIIPDEELALIPFEVFLQGRLAVENNSRLQRYLIQDYEFSYLPNSSLLREQNRKSEIGNKDMKLVSQDYMEQPGTRYKGLIAVKEETESILNLFKGVEIPANLPKRELIKIIEEADIVHFAMHNFPANDIQSSSYMVLRPKEDSSLNHLLFDYEIDPLYLQASMVVLNTCESGSGQLHPGEGVLSMARSFLLAGAQSVVSARWPVDDQAASSINIDFYKGLTAGDTKPGALREAQLKYLGKATPSFSHPYYWAGYQVMGDPSRIRINKQILFPKVMILLLVVSISGWSLNNRRKSGK